jgi:hypothetical protein
MYINLPENHKISLENLYEIVKGKYPIYEISINKEKNSIFIKVDKTYGVQIKKSSKWIAINHDLDGCIILIIPEIVLLLFLPKARTYQKLVSKDLTEILENKNYQI